MRAQFGEDMDEDTQLTLSAAASRRTSEALVGLDQVLNAKANKVKKEEVKRVRLAAEDEDEDEDDAKKKAKDAPKVQVSMVRWVARMNSPEKW